MKIVKNGQSIQKAINDISKQGGGTVLLDPVGSPFVVGSTIRLMPGVRVGCLGTTNYNDPAFMPCTIRPARGFTDKSAILADPANYGAGSAHFISGVALSDLTIDMVDVSMNDLIAIELRSVSNSGPFSNLTVLNQDVGQYLWIGASAAGARSDGITFYDFYTLNRSVDPPCGEICAAVVIEESSEIAFFGARTKIQRKSDGAFATGSVGILLRTNGPAGVGGVDFYSTSVAGFETGWRTTWESGVTMGPRFVRLWGGVCETFNVCVRFDGHGTNKTQFSEARAVRCHTSFGATAFCGVVDRGSNNLMEWSESTYNASGGVTRLVLLTEHSEGNIIFAQPVNVTVGGKNNVVLGRPVTGTTLELITTPF